jgi:Spy/CpxP family protein refolding chaperone
MKILKFFLLSIIIAGVAVAASAQDAQYGVGDRFFIGLGRVLTAEQRQSLMQIVGADHAQIHPLQEKIRASRLELLNQITSGNFNEQLARQYAAESANAEADLMVVFAKALSQMQPPLSAQQIAQIKNLGTGHFGGGKHQGEATASEADVQPEVHLKLPPPLPSDTNGLPMVN